jgi:hypothetical protein
LINKQNTHPSYLNQSRVYPNNKPNKTRNTKLNHTKKQRISLTQNKNNITGEKLEIPLRNWFYKKGFKVLTHRITSKGIDIIATHIETGKVVLIECWNWTYGYPEDERFLYTIEGLCNTESDLAMIVLTGGYLQNWQEELLEELNIEFVTIYSQIESFYDPNLKLLFSIVEGVVNNSLNIVITNREIEYNQVIEDIIYKKEFERDTLECWKRSKKKDTELLTQFFDISQVDTLNFKTNSKDSKQLTVKESESVPDNESLKSHSQRLLNKKATTKQKPILLKGHQHEGCSNDNSSTKSKIENKKILE